MYWKSGGVGWRWIIHLKGWNNQLKPTNSNHVREGDDDDDVNWLNCKCWDCFQYHMVFLTIEYCLCTMHIHVAHLYICIAACCLSFQPSSSTSSTPEIPQFTKGWRSSEYTIISCIIQCIKIFTQFKPVQITQKKNQWWWSHEYLYSSRTPDCLKDLKVWQVRINFLGK